MKPGRLERSLRWWFVGGVLVCCGCPSANFVLLADSSLLIVSQDPLPVTFRVRTGTPSLDKFRRELVINVPRGNNTVEVPLSSIGDLSYCGVSPIPYTNMSRSMQFKQVDSNGKVLKEYLGDTQDTIVFVNKNEVALGLYEVTVIHPQLPSE
jgi:hypothetical protein